MSRGRKAARKVVSGLSTGGQGQSWGQGAPCRLCLVSSGTTPGSAGKEARQHWEAGLRQWRARFSSSCKQGYFSSKH